MPAFFSGAACSSHCSGVLGTCILWQRHAAISNIIYTQRVNVSIRTAFRVAVCMAAIAVIVVLYFKLLHVNPTTVALTLLLAVLSVATAWGLRYAVLTSIAAA